MSYESVLANAVGLWPLQDDAADNAIAATVGPAGSLISGTTAARTRSGPTAWLPKSIYFLSAFNLASDLATSFPYTFAAWVRHDATVTGERALIGNQSALRTLKQTSGGALKHEGGGTTANIFSLGSMRTDEWFHLAVTVNSTGLAVYYDGVFEDAALASGITGLTINQIGGERNQRYFEGDMAQAGVWPELTLAEIGELVAGPTATNTKKQRIHRHYLAV